MDNMQAWLIGTQGMLVLLVLLLVLAALVLLIVLLALLMKEGYLMDIALIYAMLSFLAVVLLCKIYIGIHRAKKEKEEKQNV